jgi:hypothetical protein
MQHFNLILIFKSVIFTLAIMELSKFSLKTFSMKEIMYEILIINIINEAIEITIKFFSVCY